ncbi:uncharacterized protein [Triticum aestivum]|uniref:uncharacterized protein isoform X1 n=1 Tax=Triticum aestivum TaxID=4565 RepID=UPI001D00DFF1|nr:uncharacterized protein LOC123134402 isoform X1 [Triticum aestivum]
MLRKPWRRCRSTLANLKMTELEILGINFVCVLSALSDAKIPEKECLLPLVSKLLGYCIVAASTTVKLPQAHDDYGNWRQIPAFTGTCLKKCLSPSTSSRWPPSSSPRRRIMRC